MNIRNLGLALATVGALGSSPDGSKLDGQRGNNIDNDIPAVTAPEITKPKGVIGDKIKAATSEESSSLESNDSPQTTAELIAKIQLDCPDHASMLAQNEPELYDLLQAEHPQILQASILTPILETAGAFLKLLYGVLGSEGTIVVAILMYIFGIGPVLKKGWQFGKWSLDKAGNKKKPEELGEVIPKKELPAMNSVLGELVADTSVALAALSPISRGDLDSHYTYIVSQFDNLRFEDKSEGLELFKLAIKERYLDLRLTELQDILSGPGAAALAPADVASMEAELADLTTKEGHIAQEIASNELSISSVRNGKEESLTRGLQVRVRAAMRNVGRTTPAINESNRGVESLIMIPRLHKMESNLREIRILEGKLKIWKARYEADLRLAGPGAAPIAIATSAVEQQQYQQAAAFISIYESLQLALRDKLDERHLHERAIQRIDQILPTSPGRRTFMKLALTAGAAYGATWAVRGLGAAKDAVWPKENPPEGKKGPSESEILERKDREDSLNKSQKAIEDLDDK
ncbi:MAG: hypothetical protein NTZ25_03140 [Candidatus Peregrinibacteria bacterium]|nr:hypothetical protein [Candidatus Peregrinibacteria bacterium]